MFVSIIHPDHDPQLISHLTNPLDILNLAFVNDYYFNLLHTHLAQIRALCDSFQGARYKLSCCNNIQWFIRHHLSFESDSIELKKLIEFGFRSASETSTIDTMRFLLSYAEGLNLSINIHLKRELAFRKACRINSYELLTYLFSLEKSYGVFDLHTTSDNALRLAFAHSDLTICTDLIQRAKDRGCPYDLHRLDEILFRLSIESNNLAGCEYLIKLCEESGRKINIHVRDDIIMLETYRLKHTTIITYLLNLSIKGYGAYPEDFYLLEAPWQ